MKIVFNLAEISQEMCIEAIRRIFDINRSATIYFGDEKSIVLEDVNNHEQLVHLIPSVYSKLLKIDINPNGEDIKFVADESQKDKFERNHVVENNEPSEMDTVYEIFAEASKEVKKNSDSTMYAKNFVNKVLGVDEANKDFNIMVTAFGGMALKPVQNIRKKDVKELLEEADFSRFYAKLKYQCNKYPIIKERHKKFHYIVVVKFFVNFFFNS